MKKLLVLVPLAALLVAAAPLVELADGVSDVPKVKTPQKAELKIKPNGKAEVTPVKFDATDRRDELRLRMAVLAQNIATTRKVQATVKSILYAEAFTEDNDAAMVIFGLSGSKDQGLFLIFNKGHWEVFPTDLIEATDK